MIKMYIENAELFGEKEDYSKTSQRDKFREEQKQFAFVSIQNRITLKKHTHTEISTTKQY